MKRSALTSLLLLLFLAAFASAPDPALDLPVTKDPPGVLIPAPVTSASDDEDDPRDEPPPVFFGEEIESANDTIVYVIDVSCSMNAENRMEKAKRELTRSIAGLPSSFKFNVVSYSCTLQKLFRAPVPADSGNKITALAYVEGLGPNSGTATGPGVSLGLSDREAMKVALLTDGEPNCGAEGAEGHRAMIRNNNVQRAAVDVFGISASGSWRAFCQSVAADSGGSYYDVP